MTTYATKEDLRANVGGLTADSRKADDNFLNDLLERKSALIDSFVQRRYLLPIPDNSTAMTILKDICINLCREEISVKLQVSTMNKDGSQVPVGRPLTTKARETLKLIQQGKFNLPGATTCDDCSVFSGGSYDDCEAQGIPFDSRQQEDRPSYFNF